MASGGVLTLIPPSPEKATQLGDVVEALIRDHVADETEDVALEATLERYDDCIVIRENTYVQPLDTHGIIGVICHEHTDLLDGWGRVGGEDVDGTTNVTNIEVTDRGEIQTADRQGIAKLPSECGKFTFESTRLRKPQL